MAVKAAFSHTGTFYIKIFHFYYPFNSLSKAQIPDLVTFGDCSLFTGIETALMQY